MVVLASVIRRGDSTSHGGVVVEGFSEGQWDIDGIPAAGLGHVVTCPIHPGVHRIAEGASHVSVQGTPIALNGMKTTCGATLIASQHIASAEPVGTTNRTDSGVVAPTVHAAGRGDSGYADVHSHDQGFQLIDEATGEPVANRAYRITINGRTYDGKTDAGGQTQRISADSPITATIEIFAEGM